MGKTWVILIAISLFFIITFLFWKLTSGYSENKLYGKKMWKQWGAKTFYWQYVLLISGGLTIMAMFLLKWGNVLTF